MIEEEKRIIDDKIDRSKYTFLVVKSHYYKELTEALRSLNEQISNGIINSHKQINDIVKFEQDEKLMIDSLTNILN